MTHVHNYNVVKSTPSATVEVCSECKKRLVTKMDKQGRIDNVAYLKEHVRDTAQPTGATAKVFKQYYPKAISCDTKTNNQQKDRSV